LNRPADNAANPGTLQISGSPSVARIQTDAITSPEGGAYVLGTSSPSSVTFTYGSDLPGGPETHGSRQAAAFGIIPSQTIVGNLNVPVPANHPLALFPVMLALGWLAKRKLGTG
jgi:hypothetical protein